MKKTMAVSAVSDHAIVNWKFFDRVPVAGRVGSDFLARPVSRSNCRSGSVFSTGRSVLIFRPAVKDSILLFIVLSNVGRKERKREGGIL